MLTVLLYVAVNTDVETAKLKVETATMGTTFCVMHVTERGELAVLKHKMESKCVQVDVLFALNFKKLVKIRTHQTHKGWELMLRYMYVMG